jgi:hypothetical protein
MNLIAGDVGVSEEEVPNGLNPRCAARRGWALTLALAACGHAPSPVRPANAVPAQEAVTAGTSSAPTTAPAGTRLTMATVRLVESLNDRLSVEFFRTPGLPGFDRLSDELSSLLREYEGAGQGRLELSILDATAEDVKARAKMLGVTDNVFSQAGSAVAVRGCFGLAFRYQSERDVIPLLLPNRHRGLEYWITTVIRELRDKAEKRVRRIGVISGKHELALSAPLLVTGPDSLNVVSVVEQAFPFYDLEAVDLEGGQAEVDPGLEGLLVTQPGLAYSDPELRRLDQYVLRGRALAVFASAATLVPHDGTLKATLRTHGLERLTSGYGIAMNPDVVIDEGAAWTVPVIDNLGKTHRVAFPAILRVEAAAEPGGERPGLDPGFAGFYRTDEAAFPFASSLTLLPDRQPADVKLRPVARSAPTVWVETNSPVDLGPNAVWRAPREPQARILAAVAEGRLRSAFAGVDSDRSSAFARVLVVSSGWLPFNPFVYASPPDGAPTAGMSDDERLLLSLTTPYAHRNLSTAIFVLKNALDWMTSEPDLLEVIGKRRAGAEDE